MSRGAGGSAPVRTRRAVSADRAGITRVAGHWGDVVARAGAVVAPDHCDTIVADRAGDVVGVVRLQITGGRCEVVTIDADPPGEGTGRALLDAVVDLAGAAGCSSVWLVTTNDNLGARRAYRAYGFELAGIDLGAVDRARASTKPAIPAVGDGGIPIRDELRYELTVPRGRGHVGMGTVRSMGETVELEAAGERATGYLAVPESGSGPGIVVVQEWWGLVPQIRGVCDRLADEGFVALAPDLFHGEIAEHTEMDKAAALMNELPLDRAARDMSAAVGFLLDHEAVAGEQVGVVGFCMGGMLALVLAAQEGNRVGAVVPFYGAPLGDSEPDWSGLTAPVLGHFAADDAFFAADQVLDLESRLRDLGKDVTFTMYPGTGHAFGNETNALGTYDADATVQSWLRTLEFLRSTLV